MIKFKAYIHSIDDGGRVYWYFLVEEALSLPQSIKDCLLGTGNGFRSEKYADMEAKHCKGLRGMFWREEEKSLVDNFWMNYNWKDLFSGVKDPVELTVVHKGIQETKVFYPSST